MIASPFLSCLRHFLSYAAFFKKFFLGTFNNKIKKVVKLVQKGYGYVADCFRAAFTAFLDIFCRICVAFCKSSDGKCFRTIFVPKLKRVETKIIPIIFKQFL